MTSHSEQHAISPVPDGYTSITPWVIAEDSAAFIRFARQVFNAEERFPPVYTDETQTRIAHAEIQIGTSVIMMFDRGEGWRPTGTFLNLYVADCDEVHHRALAAGAVEITPISTNAWGDRGSRIRDPFGNVWWIQSHVADLTEDEIEARMGESEYQEDLVRSAETLDREMKRRPQ